MPWLAYAGYVAIAGAGYGAYKVTSDTLPKVAVVAGAVYALSLLYKRGR